MYFRNYYGVILHYCGNFVPENNSFVDIIWAMILPIYIIDNMLYNAIYLPWATGVGVILTLF